MTISVKKPAKPEPRPCVDCPELIEPYYLEPVIFSGRVLEISNKWVFGSERCEKCVVVHEEKLRIEEIRRQVVVEAMRKGVEKEHQQRRLLEMIGPKGMSEFDLEKYKDVGNGLTQIARAFDPTKQNLYLWGTTGAGKTHIAIGILKKFFLSGLSGYYTKHANLNRSFQGLMSDAYDEKLKEFVNLDVFVVDDMGTAKQTDFADQVLYEIIDGRYMNYKKGMVITSNLSIRDLALKLGDDRLTSRIAGEFNVVKVEGRDWRLKRVTDVV